MERSVFISAMRQVANSVTIVTTNGPAGRYGATVSAFCSVSADPPTVLVCLHSGSRIAEFVKHNQCFNVNVLPDGKAELADRFAGMHDKRIADRFEGMAGIEVEVEIEGDSVPAFTGATVFKCQTENSILSGTHNIVIGNVVSASLGSKQPLTYLDGAYQQVVPLEVDLSEAINE